jgi:hypothetical protein
MNRNLKGVLKGAWLGAAASMLWTGAALANDTMDAMIGSSVVYSYAGGATITAYYAADGSYTTDSAGAGTWTMNGDELCIKTDDGKSGCTTLASGKSKGDTWQGVDAFGNPVTISIQ